MRKPIFFLLLCCLSVSAWSTPAAELLIRGGTIYTMNKDQPTAEAVVVSKGVIHFVGDEAKTEPYIGSNTRTLDLDGKTMIPGFIEGHGHLMSLGRTLQELDVSGVTSYSALVDRVAAAVALAKPGEWIVGSGWHQSKWQPQPKTLVKGFQTHPALSAVSPDNPVLLTHASGHAVFVNAKAMALAEIDKTTSFTDGGEIIKDDDGNPTGILTENAMQLLESKLPPPTAKSERRALRLALRELAENGITSFQDAGSVAAEIKIMSDFREKNKLTSRLWVMLAGWERDLLADWFESGPRIDKEKQRLTIRAIKLSADGALGSRGAWLLEPYADRADHSGAATIPMSEVYRVSKAALKNGFQLGVHAIGDRANREVLDQFEKAFDGKPSTARFRIEHAQHLSAADIPRFAQLGVIASMQGIHMSSDRPWAIDRLGRKRIEEGAYVWRKLLDSGAIIINGTDVPIEPINPIASFYSLVTRKTLAGTPENGYEPGQTLTRQEALKSYTLDAAYAAFEEDSKGSIEVGKLADFTILSDDILRVPESQLLKTQVEKTIVGGRLIYARDKKSW